MSLQSLSLTGVKRTLAIAVCACVVLLFLCGTAIAIAESISGNASGGIGNGAKLSYTTIPVSSEHVYTKGSLLLVNNTYAIRTYPEDDALLTIYGIHKHDSYKIRNSTLRLQSEALTAFNEMLDAYFAQTNDGTVMITSAYRTEKEQEALANTSTVLPGHSDHHLGLSVALKCMDGATSDLAKDHWVYQHCHEYGFIQRYPAGKEESTGDTQSYLNCLRYVGVAHATYMKENNLSLEEYIALLKEYTYEGLHLQVKVGNSTYEIYSIAGNFDVEETTSITTLHVPEDAESYPYTYSGNNIDGFIVTIKVK